MQGKIFKSDNPWIEHIPHWVKTTTGASISLFQNIHKTNQKPYLFVGGVHGDEPEGVRLADEFLLWLKSHSNDQDHPWILIPCLNVDGFSRKQRTNAQGVDLNRNFPSRDWAPQEEKNRYYPGAKAASEPEVLGLVSLIKEQRPSVIFHFHSWKPCIVYTGEPGKVYAEFLTQGNPYQAHAEIGYPTPGSLGQFGWLDCQTPVICIEEQEHSSLDEVWPHFKIGLTGLVKGRLP
jgi:murein peptide amidase A